MTDKLNEPQATMGAWRELQAERAAPNYIKREDIKVGDRVRRTYTDTREGTVVFVAAPALCVVESADTSSVTFSTGTPAAPTTHIYGAKFELLDRPKPKPGHGTLWIVSSETIRLIYNENEDVFIVWEGNPDGTSAWSTGSRCAGGVFSTHTEGGIQIHRIGRP